MGQELVKQNAAIVTFQKQPQQFLESIGNHLDTFQKVYRTKLPADELVMWRETLKDYSVQEFEAAMADLVTHPPKYELEDGSIQVWRGMPKLPDVVNVMLDLREKKAAEWRAREQERAREEWRQMEQRRNEHPEEFFTLADVLKRANLTDAQIIKEWPQEPKEQSAVEYAQRQNQLEEQKKKLLKNS